MKKVITRAVVSRKNFSYEQEGISLSFNLRTDVSKELRIWLELMEAARKDVEETLKGLKN